MKKGSFASQEPTGEPDPPETSKEAQRREWRRIMEESRKRQDEVEMEEKAKQESSKTKKRKKSTAAGAGGEVERVSDVRNFWRRRESQCDVQEAGVMKKRKLRDPSDQPDGGQVPEIRKKLCVQERATANSNESGKAGKIKSKIKNFNILSSSNASAGGGVQGGRVAEHHADLGGGRVAAQKARARISALQSSIARPDSAADGEQF